jgi:hypothetical protein
MVLNGLIEDFAPLGERRNPGSLGQDEGEMTHLRGLSIGDRSTADAHGAFVLGRGIGIEESSSGFNRKQVCSRRPVHLHGPRTAGSRG